MTNTPNTTAKHYKNRHSVYKTLRVFLLCILAAAVLLTSLCGCSPDDSEPLIIKYNVSSPAVSFDPQLAADSTSATLIENCFEGLLRIDNNGNVVLGAAESCKVTNHGTVYIFKLKEGLTWSDGETPVTPDDFKFAFERLFTSATASRHTSGYLCINNAQQCLDGTLPLSSLGVITTEDTIRFVLEYANPNFPYLLASSPAMPCNRAFFEQTRGKYGKNLSNTLFNGPFTVDTYKENRYYLLRRNDSYHSPVSAFGVNIYITDQPNIDRLNDEKADIAKISNSDISLLDPKQFTTHNSEDIVWTLAFNTASDAMSSYYLRMAMVLSMDPLHTANRLKDTSYRPAAALVPGATEILGENYRKLAGENLTLEKDIFAAKEYLNLAYDEFPSGLPKLTLLCPNTEAMTLLCGDLQSDWQQNIALFVNLEILPVEELLARASSGNYQLALLPTNPEYNSPASLLGAYLSDGNVCRYNAGENYAQRFAEALLCSDPADAAKIYRRMETELIENAVLVPMFYETSSYAVSADITNLGFRPFAETLFFGFAEKPAQ
ncbi:MAG: peptide ABC transporter substrate-binding protein [Oscillospiraceae bacterium]|nr:peptide ABC transporter substrate-binding protein [Oscillospiraceae bacterium]MBQ9939384.1 peptide ABC transporter substrate-binding protein [Oscillospiraceae bacterium]